jgi:hypothetical protein
MKLPNNEISSSTSPSQNNISFQVVAIWLVLRVVTSLWAALVSPLRPLTAIEKAIPLWPPSSPPSVWLDRVFLAPWLRWDAVWYTKIVSQGYKSDDGTAQFHPLYPWLATPFTRLGVHPMLSLLLVSSLASFLLLLFFGNLARIDQSPDEARASTLLFASFPVAISLFAPYSEALFLTCAVLSVWWMRRGHWWLAGLGGALATLTRQQGIFLALPLAWELWEAAGHSTRRAFKNWRDWMSLAMIPAGWLIWLIYRAVALSDLSLNGSNFHAFIYSLLISPSANKVVTIQSFVWPWQALKLALDKLLSMPDVDIVTDLLLGACFILLIALSWQKIHPSYRLYSLAITLIGFSYYTGPDHPYMGLPRHLFLAFPVFIGLGAVVHKHWQRLLMAGIGFAAMLFLCLLYVLEVWVP